jgi:hypothetical protein
LNGLRKLATVIAFLLPADTVDDVASTIFFMKTASQRQKLADIVALSSSPSSTPRGARQAAVEFIEHC